MENVRYLGVVFVLLFLLSACEPTATVQRTNVSTPLPSPSLIRPTVPETTPVYAGLKATISMAPMEGVELIPVKWGGVGVAPEINAVFESAIMAKGKFRLVNRGSMLKNAMQEQDLATAGRIRKDTAVKTGEITGSDLQIKARITGFDPGDSGIGAGVGIVGRAIGGWLGAGLGLAGAVRTSRLVIDINVIDMRSTETVITTTVEGNSTDLGGGVGAAGGSVFGGVVAWKNTPMEKSLRAAVEKAADEIALKLPPEYLKYP